MLEATAVAEEGHFWFIGLRRNALMLLRAALDGQQPARIVDCGAGTGRNLDWLGTLGWAVGLERSPVGLRFGRVHGRRLVQGTVAALPFADASMDVATSFDVLYCLDDATERTAVSEMWRVLKPGGLAVINVAALDSLRGSHSTLTREVRRYSKHRLRAILTGAGFEVERLTFANMTTFPITWLMRWRERMTGRADTASVRDLQVPARPINAMFNAVLALEARAMRVVSLPIGTSLLCVARKKAGPSSTGPDVRSALAADPR
jgi:SAM-dependent methyltransferase